MAGSAEIGGRVRDLYYLDPEMSSDTRFAAPVSARSLVDGVRADVEALLPALEALLFPTGVPPGVDPGAVFRAFGLMLERDLAGLAACDRLLHAMQAPAPANAAEAPEVGDIEQQRAAAIENLRAALLRVRTLVMAAFGPSAVNACALSGPVPDAPERLIAYARIAVRALASAAPAYGEVTPFATLDLAGAAAFVRRHVEELELLAQAGDARLREVVEARRERIAGDCEHHLQAIRLMIDALLWLVHRDPSHMLRRRAVTEELPAVSDTAAALGA